MKFYTNLLPILIVISMSMLNGCKHDPEQNASPRLIVENPTKKSILIILNNATDHVIYLDKAKKQPAASAGWASQLDPGKYSVLLTEQDSFIFTCKNEKYETIDCHHAITFKIKPILNRSKVSQGSYWITENKTKHQLDKLFNKEKF